MTYVLVVRERNIRSAVADNRKSDSRKEKCHGKMEDAKEGEGKKDGDGN